MRAWGLHGQQAVQGQRQVEEGPPLSFAWLLLLLPGHITPSPSQLPQPQSTHTHTHTPQIHHALPLAASLCASYREGAGRRYSPYTQLLLQALRTHPDLHTLPQLAHDYLMHTSQRPAQSSSNRVEREPWGWADNGAAVRAAPIGLAYRWALLVRPVDAACDQQASTRKPARRGPNRPLPFALLPRRHAPQEVLQQAVHSSLLFSHTHELGRDGALVQAAAVAFLSK